MMKQLFLTILVMFIFNSTYAQVKATSAEINTGTDDDKFATALALQGSKYLDQNGAKISAVTAAGANTYTANIVPAITAYSSGQVFYIKITTANTGTATLNLNGLGAKTLVKDASTALVAGDLLAGRVYVVYYDGSNFQVLNPATTGYYNNSNLNALTAPGSTGGTDANTFVSGHISSYWGTTWLANNWTNAYGGLIAFKGSGTQAMQIQYDNGHGTSTRGRLAFRTLNSSGFTTWKQLWSSGDFNTTNINNWDASFGWGNHAGIYPTYVGTGATGTWGIGITGNAATSTKLLTTRSINGIGFNGTADITIPVVGLGSTNGGVTPSENIDANGVLLTNRTWLSTSATNKPIAENGFLGTDAINNLYTAQTFMSGQNKDAFFYRVKSNGTQLAWNQVASREWTNGQYYTQLNSNNRFLPYSFYSYPNGAFIQTDIVATGASMFTLHVKGNGYQTNSAFSIDVQGYNYDPQNAILAAKAISVGIKLTVDVFIYNGNICFWIPQAGPSQTLIATAYGVNAKLGNRVTSITHDIKPTTGVTRNVTITPVVSYTDVDPIAKYVLGANTAITNADDIASAFGKVQGQINAANALDANAVHKTGNETIAGVKLFSTSVGIGTANVHSYKLAVGGGIIAESVKVKPQAQWPDYVFEKDYPILPLNELEKFVLKNKHLPNIPNAAEVKKDGIDVGEMNAKLLQKIEELTLYLIDLKKENETLKDRMDKLEKNAK